MQGEGEVGDDEKKTIQYYKINMIVTSDGLFVSFSEDHDNV